MSRLQTEAEGKNSRSTQTEVPLIDDLSSEMRDRTSKIETKSTSPDDTKSTSQIINENGHGDLGETFLVDDDIIIYECNNNTEVTESNCNTVDPNIRTSLNSVNIFNNVQRKRKSLDPFIESHSSQVDSNIRTILNSVVNVSNDDQRNKIILDPVKEIKSTPDLDVLCLTRKHSTSPRKKRRLDDEVDHHRSLLVGSKINRSLKGGLGGEIRPNGSKSREKNYDVLSSDCKECGLYFPNKRSLLIHMKNTHVKSSVSKEKALPSKPKILKQLEKSQEIEIITGRVHKCENCGVPFPSLQSKRRHKVEVCRKILKCSECQQVFESFFKMNAHRLTHFAQPYQICNSIVESIVNGALL